MILKKKVLIWNKREKWNNGFSQPFGSAASRKVCKMTASVTSIFSQAEGNLYTGFILCWLLLEMELKIFQGM